APAQPDSLRHSRDEGDDSPTEHAHAGDDTTPRRARPGTSGRAIGDATLTRHSRAVRAAEEEAPRLDPMPDDFATAMGAHGCELVNCTLEAVEDVRLARRDDLERLVVVIAADFASRHG